MTSHLFSLPEGTGKENKSQNSGSGFNYGYDDLNRANYPGDGNNGGDVSNNYRGYEFMAVGKQRKIKNQSERDMYEFFNTATRYKSLIHGCSNTYKTQSILDIVEG